jgi:hypothetical protein
MSKHIELIYLPFIYKYFIVCFLISIIYQNVIFSNSDRVLNKKLLLFISYITIYLIPFYSFFNLSFIGQYYQSNIFVFEYLFGFIIFKFLTRLTFLSFKKLRSLILIFCIIISVALIKSIISEVSFIMTLP